MRELLLIAIIFVCASLMGYLIAKIIRRRVTNLDLQIGAGVVMLAAVLLYQIF